MNVRASMLQRSVSTPARHCLFVIVIYTLLFTGFFSPAIFRGSLLAVDGDGLYVYLSNFYSHKVLWDTLLFSGFPMMADPQVMTWYPPAFLLSFLPGSWNVFMILAYVAGSSFMYGYLYTLTRSRFAALTSGLMFGLSGFMMAHLGHAVIVHAACWIPLIIWALEKLRQQLTAKWLLIGVAAVTLCFLGGHSQIFFYGLILSGGYALVLGWSAPIGRWRYYLASLLMVILGMSLAAIQIIPTAELLSQSARVGYSFQDFASHSLPSRQALTMIFPASFGAMPESGALPYFGAVNQTELTGYVGLLALMLTALGVIAAKKRALAWFWLGVAVLAFLLAMGDATPLARLIYHVPILNGFRAPARHFIELTMAASVLSGLAVAAILRQEVSAKLIRRNIMIAGAAMVIFVVLLLMNSSYMSALAAQKGVARLSLLPWKNRAVGTPIVVFLLGAAGLAYWHRQPASGLRRALLLLMLIVDLGSFGWFYEWRYAAPDKNALNPTEVAVRYRTTLDATRQRLMPYRGWRGSLDEMPPNLSRLWRVPSASGYNVLVFSRVSNLLPMIDIIGLPLPWSERENKSLDVMAARYFFFPQNKTITDSGGVSWIDQNAEFWLGSGCNELPRSSATLNLPTPLKGTALAIVSRLGCSSQIPDGAEVVRLRITDAQGKVEKQSLLAGRDASEWAYDCSGVNANVRHRRARIFSSYPSRIKDSPCEGHYYVTTLKLNQIKDIKSVDFEWVGGPGALILDKLSLIDEPTGTSLPIDSALIDSSRWRLVEETEGARVYENLRAMPRAWLAPEIVSVDPNQALDAIKTGKLPDGRGFDPARTALIEGSQSSVNDADAAATATVTTLLNTQMEVRTKSTRAGFLVTSDAYYPGWRASIDGRDVPLYRADYAIRGVMVPAGEHTVRFDYRPHSFYLGAGISLLSLLLLSALAVGARVFRVGAGGTR
jgi:Bacterial membrane protein YfhO